MAKNSLNWNIVLVGGLGLAGLYFYNRVSKSRIIGTDYISGITGQTLDLAPLEAVMFDLRESANIAKIQARNPTAQDYVSGLPTALPVGHGPLNLISGDWQRKISNASQQTIRTDLRQTAGVLKTQARQDASVAKVDTRQTERTARTEIRHDTKQTRIQATADILRTAIENRPRLIPQINIRQILTRRS